VHGDALLADVRAAPDRTALFLDVDGVLAPIVPRPQDARVPEETRAELRRLSAAYALVACVSGRTSEDARRIVGLDALVYVGEHGLELAPDAPRWRGTLVDFASTVDWPVEDKGLTLSFHYRGVEDEGAARTTLAEVAERARAQGLVARFGRKVLELRPPVRGDKGTAVKALLAEHNLRRALYAGDDTTDLDAFSAPGDGLELGVRVAVASPEGPPELAEAADVVVDGPGELLALLRKL
jgi:trehalose 6-phosphate phosphatase